MHHLLWQERSRADRTGILNIDGQFESYLAKSLRQYCDGQRTNPIMALQFEIFELTEADIKAFASHYAAQPSVLHGLGE